MLDRRLSHSIHEVQAIRRGKHLGMVHTSVDFGAGTGCLERDSAVQASTQMFWRRPALVQQVTNSQNGVRKQHTRTREDHDLTHLLAHVAPVTMHRALLTGGLVRFEDAMIQACHGVGREPRTARTQARLMMPGAAIYLHHVAHGLALTLEAGGIRDKAGRHVTFNSSARRRRCRQISEILSHLLVLRIDSTRDPQGLHLLAGGTHVPAE